MFNMYEGGADQRAADMRCKAFSRSRAFLVLMNTTPDEVRSTVRSMSSSLQILLPRAGPLTICPAGPSDITGTLERLSADIVLALPDNPSADNPAYAYLAEGHISSCPSRIKSCTRADFIEFRAAFARRQPNFRMEILDTVSHVMETRGRATVWMTCRLSHYDSPDTPTRESVAILRWQRNKHHPGWSCVSSVFMHGHWE
jgi:hypothetical protein